MRRLLIAAAILVAVLALLILILPNILLKGTSLRGKLQKGQDEFFVDYASASSPWPGVVHLRGLILRDRDRSTEWAFQAEEVRVRFSLLALAQRRIEVRGVRGSGLSFRARSRPKPGAKKRDPRQLPSIPGFAAEPPPKEAPGTARPKKASSWTIQVERIDLPVREIWVNHVRWTGTARLTGHFELEPGRRAQIGPALVDFADGTVLDAGTPVVAGTKGRVEATFPSFEVKRYPGNEVFKIVRGNVRLDGRLPGLEFLADAFPRSNLRGGRGEIHTDLSLAEGRGQGTMSFEARRVELKARGREIRGDLEGRLRMRDVDLARRRAVLSGSHLGVKQVFVEGSETQEPWWASLELPEAQYLGGPPRLQARLEGKMRNARPILELAAGLPKWATKGLSEREVSFQLLGSAGAGSLELKDAKATADDLSIEGRFRSRKGQERGIFLVDTDLLYAGLAVGGEKPGVKIFGPRKWYRKARAAWDAETP